MRGMHPLALIDSRTVADSFRPRPRDSIRNDASAGPGSGARAFSPRRLTKRAPLARIAGRAAAVLASLR